MARVAVIGTGGTISSFGDDPFDLQDYVRHEKIGDTETMLAHYRDVSRLAELVPIAFPPVASTKIGFGEWQWLAQKIAMLSRDPSIDGVVILHGTATLEETAYALSLTTASSCPVVVTGAQRPATGLAADGASNLSAAIRTALSPDARGMGVLVVLNEEIHAAREVTKTSTWRLQTFRTPDFGVLGHADADSVSFYRRPLRASLGTPAFDISGATAAPRVDIAYAYQGADGVAVEAFVDAGAKGIIAAAFAPGLMTPALSAALEDAVSKGVVCAISTRAGSGRVVELTPLKRAKLIPADNLNPQKARVLLQFALVSGSAPEEIAEHFLKY
ncbi:MAG: asparaginase [Pseudomonadota bacterium]